MSDLPEEVQAYLYALEKRAAIAGVPLYFRVEESQPGFWEIIAYYNACCYCGEVTDEPDGKFVPCGKASATAKNLIVPRACHECIETLAPDTHESPKN